MEDFQFYRPEDIRRAKEMLIRIIGTAVGVQVVVSEDEIYQCSGVHIGGGSVLSSHHALNPLSRPERIIVSHGRGIWTAQLAEAPTGLDMMYLRLNDYQEGIVTPEVQNENSEFDATPGERLFIAPYFPQRRLLSSVYYGKDMQKDENSVETDNQFGLFPQYDIFTIPDTPLEEGHSGAGIFNIKGKLLAIVRAKGEALSRDRSLDYPLAVGVSLSALTLFGRPSI